MKTAAGIKKRSSFEGGESEKPGLTLISKQPSIKPKRFTIGLCENLSFVQKGSIRKPVPHGMRDLTEKLEVSAPAVSSRVVRGAAAAVLVAGVAGLIFGLLVGRRISK